MSYRRHHSTFGRVRDFSFCVLLLYQRGEQFRNFFYLSLCTAVRRNLCLIQECLSSAASNRLLTYHSGIHSKGSVFSNVIRRRGGHPIILLRVSIVRPSRFFQYSLPGREIKRYPQFAKGYARVILRLSTPISATVATLVENRFLLPIRSSSFFAVGLSVCFFSRGEVECKVVGVFRTSD